MIDYKLVPVEPTQEMVDAGRTARTDPAERYKAMVAAAPDVQGEPVAYLRKDQLDHVKRMGTMLGEIADCPRVDRVPLYTAPQPAEQQSAPNVVGMVAWATRLYNTAYHAGHHDTVEGCYTHVHPQDMDSYHEDIVQEWLADNQGKKCHINTKLIGD